MSRSVAWCVSILSLGLVLASVRPCVAQATILVSDAQVKDQIEKLDDDDIVVRDAAERQLHDWAKNNQLTPAQAGFIKAARADASLERSFRAKRVFETYVNSNPAIRAVLRPVRVWNLGGVAGGKLSTVVIWFPGQTPPDNPQFAELSKRYGAVRDAILAGDTAPGPPDGLDPITRALKRLRDYVTSLSDAELKALGAWDPDTGNPATRQQLLDKIQQAIDAVPGARDALGSLTGGNLPPSATLAYVHPGIPSHPDLGKSFALAIDRVELGTALDVCWFVDSETLSNPPFGYQAVGHVIDVLATDSLVAFGNVTVSIAIGSSVIGNPVADPALLQIAHMANGHFDLVPSLVDLVGGWVTATYPLPPPGSGLEPFGEFAIVQPGGTAAVPVTPERGLRLEPPLPNPCAGSASITYALPVAGPVELEIYDLRGARVKCLARQIATAGVHAATWDGRNADGATVGPGCYFVRLRAGGQQVVRTMLRVR